MINLQPCIRRPRCDKSRANSTPRRPCCQQQAPLPTSTQHAPRPTSCSRLTLQQTSSQTLLQGLFPSWSILIFVRPSSQLPLARSFLWETTAPPSHTTSKKIDLRNIFRELHRMFQVGQLQNSLTFGGLLSQPSFFKFFGGLFVLGRYSPLQI